jgi:hypothetical protein
LISKKFEKEIVFESSVLAWIRIRIEQKCRIRIRIKSIRIHNHFIAFTVKRLQIRDAPDIRPDNPAFFDSRYPAGYRIALPDIRPDIR